MMEMLKSAFLETANHYAALGRHDRHYAAILLHASLDPWDVFDNEELARATRGLPQEGLKAAVAALAGAIDGAGVLVTAAYYGADEVLAAYVGSIRIF